MTILNRALESMLQGLSKPSLPFLRGGQKGGFISSRAGLVGAVRRLFYLLWYMRARKIRGVAVRSAWCKIKRPAGFYQAMPRQFLLM